MCVENQCPKCKKIKLLTVHHLIPQRFLKKNLDRWNRLDLLFPEYFSEDEQGSIALLCRPCHDELEKLIPFYEMLTPEYYFSLYDYFILEQPITETLLAIWIYESRQEIFACQKRLFYEYDLDVDDLPRQACFR